MSRIRSSGNKDTELRMISVFRRYQITGWRRGQKLMGKPDFVFRREKVIVFVDGCFWHGCPKPKHARSPKNRAEWWAAKLQKNKDRDRRVTRELRKHGWKVIRVWECDLAPKCWPGIRRRVIRALGCGPPATGELHNPRQFGLQAGWCSRSEPSKKRSKHSTT